MAVITKEQMALMAEIKSDPIAYRALQMKALWEQETLFYVLREWGDPRGPGWDSYRAAAAKELAPDNPPMAMTEGR